MPAEAYVMRRDEPEWTPARGMARGTMAGVLVAAGLGLAFYALAYGAPFVTLNFALRVAWSFGVTWIVFTVVQRAAGMVGWPVTILGVVLSMAVILASHAAYAQAGVPTRDGVVDGWARWFHPWNLFVANLPTFIGVGVCAWREHEG